MGTIRKHKRQKKNSNDLKIDPNLDSDLAARKAIGKAMDRIRSILEEKIELVDLEPEIQEIVDENFWELI